MVHCPSPGQCIFNCDNKGSQWNGSQSSSDITDSNKVVDVINDVSITRGKVKPHSHCAQYGAVLRRTAQHCAEPLRTALIDYMEINCSIHTESSAAQYCATFAALFALRANRAAKCSAVLHRAARSVNGQRSAAPSCPHYARHVIHEY